MNITKENIKEYIIDNIKVEVKNVSSEPPKANIKLQLPGLLSIKGFTLKLSKFEHKNLGDFVWIQPTSIRRNDGGYMEVIFFEDKELWETIELKIYEAYKNAESKNNYE